ncbi:MAG: hypothetical protein KatS3mg076_2873 [Candidatus Binatia bacterium]|nr:MAG: hypothetical protein KatS3mg076_2873 [Candidatus Binatia bacterium]
MASEREVTDSILHVLRPYASNFSGSLGRGDLVIPQREIPRVIHEIVNVLARLEQKREASDGELFDVLYRSRRFESVQDQVAELRRHFVVLKR